MEENKLKDRPILNWHYRMGKHEGVHNNVYNRIIHWICIPCQIFATFLVFSNVEFGILDLLGYNLPINLSLILLFSLVYIYSLLDLYGGLYTCILWTPLLILANTMHQTMSFNSTSYEILFGLFFFISTFSIQIGIGHNVCEEGRDDTEDNMGELFHTKNPLYISLIPFYHHMEVLYAFGYDPKTYVDILVLL